MTETNKFWIRDFWAFQGKRYPLWLILLLVVMGTVSGCRSYLYWVKDVTFGEDAVLLSNYNAATNWSITRNITINLARKSGYDSLTKAERFLAHDVDKMFLLLE